MKLRAAQSPPTLMTLVFGTALSVLSLNMFLPSLPGIAAAFDADYALANLAVAGYLAVSAVLQILMGPLSDRYGRRPVMLVCCGLFVVASAGCALASNIWVFLGFRLLQGAIISGQVVSRAVIRDMYAPSAAASKLGYMGMIMALAPMLGPMIGGALDMAFGWRAGFWLYCALGGGVMLFTWADMGETNTTRSATFRSQLRLYPRLFSSRRFWGYSACVAFSIGGFYSFVTGAPLVAAAWFDLSPAMVGLGIGIITAGFMTGNFVTGLLAQRVRLLSLVLVGRVISCAGPALGLSLFWSGQGSEWVFFGSAICVGLGNGLTIANASAGLMSVRPELAGSAAGLSGALTVALGAALTSMTGVLVAPDNAPFMVLGIMLAASLLALVSALYVMAVDAADPLEPAQS
ncbi:multidrug effflux MFS transporter [Epibacterium sp. Ofav1-8]|uniref:multidrug effflux MFS transporter n=1 Tax=Epibacterium sp. Ofav1-8 TaxID=2917735 RepID=UPI001EF68763|nr:multidrug effflux MFS transporter [Epibacterium sp. Ofav1-8]MCG7623384.1 multidrug effflux MFS transporter [Epibacterium sp. Ofav1-8]